MIAHNPLTHTCNPHYPFLCAPQKQLLTSRTFNLSRNVAHTNKPISPDLNARHTPNRELCKPVPPPSIPSLSHCALKHVVAIHTRIHDELHAHHTIPHSATSLCHVLSSSTLMVSPQIHIPPHTTLSHPTSLHPSMPHPIPLCFIPILSRLIPSYLVSFYSIPLLP